MCHVRNESLVDKTCKNVFIYSRGEMFVVLFYASARLKLTILTFNLMNYFNLQLRDI